MFEVVEPFNIIKVDWRKIQKKSINAFVVVSYVLADMDWQNATIKVIKSDLNLFFNAFTLGEGILINS